MIEEEFDNVFMNGVKTLYLRGYDVCVDGGSTKSVCIGDSGGPLICEGKEWGLEKETKVNP